MNVIRILGPDDISTLIEFSKSDGFPYKLTSDEQVKPYCYNTILSDESPRTYGYFDDNKLVGVMTITCFRVFPHLDNPTGRIAHISGAYVLPEYRHKGIATDLYKEIEKDMRHTWKPDYICCDSSADDLYIKNGFIKSNESRLWKVL